MTPEEMKEKRDQYAEDNRIGIEKAGIRYIWLIVSAYNALLMIAGGALALIPLILWFILGGLRGPVSRTTVLPAVIVCCLLGAAVIVVCGLIVSPIELDELY